MVTGFGAGTAGTNAPCGTHPAVLEGANELPVCPLVL